MVLKKSPLLCIWWICWWLTLSRCSARDLGGRAILYDSAEPLKSPKHLDAYLSNSNGTKEEESGDDGLPEVFTFGRSLDASTYTDEVKLEIREISSQELPKNEKYKFGIVGKLTKKVCNSLGWSCKSLVYAPKDDLSKKSETKREMHPRRYTVLNKNITERHAPHCQHTSQPNDTVIAQPAGEVQGTTTGDGSRSDGKPEKGDGVVPSSPINRHDSRTDYGSDYERRSQVRASPTTVDTRLPGEYSDHFDTGDGTYQRRLDATPSFGSEQKRPDVVCEGGEGEDRGLDPSALADGGNNREILDQPSLAGGGRDEENGDKSPLTGAGHNEENGDKSPLAGVGNHQENGDKSPSAGGGNNQNNCDKSRLAGGGNNPENGYKSPLARGGSNHEDSDKCSTDSDSDADNREKPAPTHSDSDPDNRENPPPTHSDSNPDDRDKPAPSDTDSDRNDGREFGKIGHIDNPRNRNKYRASSPDSSPSRSGRGDLEHRAPSRPALANEPEIRAPASPTRGDDRSPVPDGDHRDADTSGKPSGTADGRNSGSNGALFRMRMREMNVMGETFREYSFDCCPYSCASGSSSCCGGAEDGGWAVCCCPCFAGFFPMKVIVQLFNRMFGRSKKCEEKKS